MLVEHDLVHDARSTCFCDHAPGAIKPLGSALELFRDDFERHIDERAAAAASTDGPRRRAPGATGARRTQGERR